MQALNGLIVFLTLLKSLSNNVWESSGLVLPVCALSTV